jgi:hypothetical protein
MIVSEFYDGQGLGNQLWAYVVLRSLAGRQGFSFGVQHPEKFKGKGIFEIDFGTSVIGGEGPEGGPPTKLPDHIDHYINESRLFENKTGLDVTSIDAALLNISDRTKFDGNFQSLKYLTGFEDHIRNWLKLRPIQMSSNELGSDVCVVHVRGGDYLNTFAFLPRKFYENAMRTIKNISPNVKFVAVTDDLKYCKNILPNIQIIGSTPLKKFDEFRAKHHLGGNINEDFAILNTAKYVILSASTFSFWAVFLNTNNPYVIAPKYWFAYSKSDGWWSTPDCIVPTWQYLDRRGKLYTGKQCMNEFITPQSSETVKLNKVASIAFRIERKLAKILMG